MSNKKARVIKSPLIEKILKETPIKTRLSVLFKLEWLTMNIIPDRHATDDEILKAQEWSNKMTKLVLEEFKQWGKRWVTKIIK